MNKCEGNNCKKHIDGIVCDVCNCVHHCDGNHCSADCIEVGPRSACSSCDTVCATFKPKDEGCF